MTNCRSEKTKILQSPPLFLQVRVSVDHNLGHEVVAEDQSCPPNTNQSEFTGRTRPIRTQPKLIRLNES